MQYTCILCVCLGISLVKGLIEEFGLEGVQAYMNHIQKNAEVSVSTLLKEVGRRLGSGNENKVSEK